MDVSVVIPCFNRESSILGAVLSVLNQIGEHNIEIIVVDDGSTDCSIDKIKDLDVKIIKTSGRTGACNARNIGILAATYDWIAFNDSDDFWRLDKLNHIETAIASNNVDFIFHPFIRLIGLKSVIGGIYNDVSCFTGKNFLSKILACNMVSTQCLIVKKTTLVECGCFDVELKRFQDWELAIRIAKKTHGMYIPELLSICVESTDSISKGFNKGVSSREYIFKKHRQLFLNDKVVMLKFIFSLRLRQIIGIFRRGE